MLKAYIFELPDQSQIRTFLYLISFFTISAYVNKIIKSG